MSVYTRPIATSKRLITKYGEQVAYSRTGDAIRDSEGNNTPGVALSVTVQILWHQENSNTRRSMMNAADLAAIEGTRLFLMTAYNWDTTTDEVKPLVGDTITLSSGKQGTVKFVDVLGPGNETVLWYIWVDIR